MLTGTTGRPPSAPTAPSPRSMREGISLAPDPIGKALRPASHRASQPVPAPAASPNRSGFDVLAAAFRREDLSPLDVLHLTRWQILHSATIPLAAVLRVHGVPLSELLTPRSDLKSLADARDDFTGGPIESATEDAEGPLHVASHGVGHALAGPVAVTALLSHDVPSLRRDDGARSHRGCQNGIARISRVGRARFGRVRPAAHRR